MNLNKDILYLEDVKLLEAIAPIMKNKGILPDGIIDIKLNRLTSISDSKLLKAAIANDKLDISKADFIYTWRKDSLELAIPEMKIRFMADRLHSISVKVHDGWIYVEPELGHKIYKMLDRARYRSAEDRNWQESLRNLAALIILVEEKVRK